MTAGLVRRVALAVGTAAGVAVVLAGCASGATKQAATAPTVGHSLPPLRTAAPTTSIPPASTSASAAPSTTNAQTHPAVHAAEARRAARARAALEREHVAHNATARSAAAHRLPLTMRTGDARQVITVTASSAASTTGTLQAWHRTGTGWSRVGSPTTAWLGTDGLSRHASESRSATPIGSFTVTQAFGHDADPGTSLPYTHTTPDDWWISQPGRLYNTPQHCVSHCSFTQGDPNEHLYYETPFYDYAAVIDYNTRNAPGGVRQGAGSAFFLHVTVHRPTQGCVSIDKGRLVTLLRWLKPSAHPRILIGTDE